MKYHARGGYFPDKDFVSHSDVIKCYSYRYRITSYNVCYTKLLRDKSTGNSMRRAISLEEISSDASSHTITQWNPKSDYFDHSLEKSKNLKKISSYNFV